ncbi:ATP-dependent RNA helicase DDX24/MAK5 [Geosmithia morbida]|uniref:ATP-dependent RNA helicase n=1 Tax=Geosmithia morbida TaxID=1094350 RepID=A0A9P4YUU4_9HYPO|nr:ATP-dependent RNA helicase DDX24/MAK5 [Geosmithia morbida]KAF4121424.1 ATP-dependent RNA helicase DDX24/MAK5 [Geosmithia morbida]
MAPQTKKRKLEATATTPASSATKRMKKQKQTPRRAVDANALAWKSVDEDIFGCLQVIDNVSVVKNGNKVEFLVKEGETKADADTNGDDKGEEDYFEGFSDNDNDNEQEAEPVEGEGQNKKKTNTKTDVVEERPGKKKNKEETKAKETGTEEKTPAIKEKKKKQQQQDAQLQDSHRVGGNAFSALQYHDNDDSEMDMAPWVQLGLSPPLLSALAGLKFAKPTKIQKRAIPDILSGESVIGKAQTGSGKTLAFGIPIVERWLELAEGRTEQDFERRKDEGTHQPLALVMSPTRELAKQIGDHIKAVCDRLPSSAPFVCVITGGLSIQKQRRQLARADIVIGTPGRLWEVLEGDSKLQDVFSKIRFLVVDEADRLFKAGQFKEAEDVIGALDRNSPADDEDSGSDDDGDEDSNHRQTLVFSATFDKELQTKLSGPRKTGPKKNGKGGDDGQMGYLMKSLRFRSEPKFIDVDPVRQMAEKLKEGLIECGAMEKDLYLYTALILNPKRRILVFANSISAVRRLTPFLQNLNLNALPLHSQMIQKARLRSLERFTAATKSSILVATDVAARGLDIPEVDMVLHYHVPRAADTYVHRSGRTARAEREGVSVMLCSPDEVLPTRRLAGKVHAEAARKHVIQTLPIDRKIVSRLKPRTDLAKKLADAVLAKEKAHGDDSFMRSAAEDLGVIYDSDEVDSRQLGYGRGGGRKKKEQAASGLSKAEMRAMRAQLRHELSQRVNLGVSERYITGGRVDVAALLRERESGNASIFLGAEGMGLGFDL